MTALPHRMCPPCAVHAYAYAYVRACRGARLSAAIGWLGRQVVAAAAFVASCGSVLPQFSVLTPRQALQRMVLILAASLLMVVLLTSIDSTLLYMYVSHARKVA